MAYDLEQLTATNEYKSYGEQRVASVLDQYGIPFKYEHPLLIEDRRQLRLWYPDFWLPDHSVAVEYFGLAGNDDYDRGIERKTKAYAENSVDMLPVFRHDLGRGLPDYLMGGIERILHDRYRRFQSAYRGSQHKAGNTY